MDSEKLIFLVFDRKLLWDQKSKGYHNRDKSRKLWEEVAAELNISSEVAKTKWKGLRDTFRREYLKANKLKQSGAEGGEKSCSSWPYFESLYFLADQMTPRECSGNIPQPQKNSLISINDEYRDQPNSPETQNTDDGVVQILASTSIANQSKQHVEERNPLSLTQQQESTSKKQKSAKRANDVQQRMLALEEEKLQIFKKRKVESDDKKDYDYHFLLGLLPHFKNVKPERKLLVQIELQKVLLNELTSYNPLPTSYTAPQCAPSPALTSPSPFSPPSVSQSSNLSTSNTPVFDHENSDIENQESLTYSIGTFVTNFQV